MASFMLCPFLLNERCCDCLDLTSMVERVDAGEQEPLSPVHGAKFGMAPDNIQEGIGLGLQDDCYQLLAKPLQISQEIRSRRFLRCRNNGILNIWRLLTALEHFSNGRCVKSGHRTHVQQDVEGRPLSFTGSRSGKCVRNGRDCGQKLLVGFLQCLDELCRSATESLTGYITAYTRDFLLAGLLTFLGHRSLPFTKASLHATTKHGGFLPKRGHYPARKPACASGAPPFETLFVLTVWRAVQSRL